VKSTIFASFELHPKKTRGSPLSQPMNRPVGVRERTQADTEAQQIMVCWKLQTLFPEADPGAQMSNLVSDL
jgi:hypothetical protein